MQVKGSSTKHLLIYKPNNHILYIKLDFVVQKEFMFQPDLIGSNDGYKRLS